MTSVIFWDGKGKNYRYTPLGASME
jgi:hypothetical protein